MSHRSGLPCSEEMAEYYENIPTQWPGIEASPFGGINPYCTEPLVPPSVLTPISLPDSSFGPSPALSHHAHDYRSQEYQYAINDSLHPPQGLGISAPFPSNFPRTSAPNAAYLYAPVANDIPHGMVQTPSQSPQGPSPSKRAKRPSSNTPSREPISNTPVSIAPNPEGVLRMEYDRQNSQPSPHILPKIRAPGRGRRDPQAEDEDAFVEELRLEHTAWKRVREEFQKKFNKDASEARLQMRLLRRQRDRMARWDDSDVELLNHALEIWERDKFRFLSNKLKELGATRLYSPDQCRTQLRFLEAKQQHRDRASASSPSAMSDPAPTTPSVSRKRPRAQSLELEFNIEEEFF
ncbi:hypothetical protein N7457_009172 [Penicillium paradoxum]|uniref:uncharacterized protein n=1 Tax=Penicillium paradoxum TaxID=176176 RepID=UPI0025490089|nr:uncharacterized protein N7457_009172 [Penicillium paradoxum]KAJ5774276.1 hypothetical protein N7457_009172 [Penicillium paradoxum]